MPLLQDQKSPSQTKGGKRNATQSVSGTKVIKSGFLGGDVARSRQALKEATSMHIERSGREVVSIELITPEVAASWLKANYEHNRKLRTTKVRNLETDFMKGRAILTNDAIVLNEDGVLLNGQHRLNACVRTGVSFEAIVLRNASTKMYAAIDHNISPRKVWEILAIDPKANTLINFLKRVHGIRDVSPEYALQVYEAFQGSIDFALYHHFNSRKRPGRGQKAEKPKGPGYKNKIVLTAALMRAHHNGHDPKKIERFCDLIFHPVGMQPHEDSVCYATKYLEENPQNGMTYYWKHYMRIAFFLREFLNDRPITSETSHTQKDPFPMEMPST